MGKESPNQQIDVGSPVNRSSWILKRDSKRSLVIKNVVKEVLKVPTDLWYLSKPPTAEVSSTITTKDALADLLAGTLLTLLSDTSIIGQNETL